MEEEISYEELKTYVETLDYYDKQLRDIKINILIMALSMLLLVTTLFLK